MIIIIMVVMVVIILDHNGCNLFRTFRSWFVAFCGIQVTVGLVSLTFPCSFESITSPGNIIQTVADLVVKMCYFSLSL